MSEKSDATKRVIVRTIAYNDKDQILIVRRSKTGSRPGQWELPGGNLDAEESLETGAQRELKEECGIELKDMKFFASDAYEYNSEARIGVLFIGKASSDSIKLSYEHDKHMWIDRSNYNNVKLDHNYENLFHELLITEDDHHEIKNNDDKVTTKVSSLKIYTDGGSRGNPGPSASGYVIMNNKDEVLEEGGEYLGITTNNQAEYQAVKLALQSASKFSPDKIDMYIDSLLVVNQMKGIYKIKNRDLWPIHESIKKLAEKYKEVTYTHVRRENNSLADSKVNEVLDSHDHQE